MSKLPLVSAILLALAMFPLIGCGNGQDRSEETVRTSTLVAVDVTAAKQNLDRVVAGLKNLRDVSDSADLKKLYVDLQIPTVELRDSVASVHASSERALVAGKEQHEEWRKQTETFSDADLRNASNSRQNDLRGAVDELGTSNVTLTTVSDAYLVQLEQSLKALDLDLTQQGLRVIKPSVDRLIEDEAKLRDALNEVATKGKAVTAVINP